MPGVFSVRLRRNGSNFPHLGDEIRATPPRLFLGVQHSMIVAIRGISVFL